MLTHYDNDFAAHFRWKLSNNKIIWKTKAPPTFPIIQTDSVGCCNSSGIIYCKSSEKNWLVVLKRTGIMAIARRQIPVAYTESRSMLLVAQPTVLSASLVIGEKGVPLGNTICCRLLPADKFLEAWPCLNPRHILHDPHTDVGE